MIAVPDRLPYDRDKFVDREEALKIVLHKARRISAGLPVERRVVIFHGQRGSGKSWLLRELERCLRDHATPHLIDLSECAEVNPLNAQISKTKTQMKAEQRPLVLLVDNVSEVSELQLEPLVERVLAPVVQGEDVLIVLVERGRPLYLAAPEFREKSDEFDLKPFEPGDIEEQIKRQVPTAAARMAEIESLGGGYPWSTYILARHLPEKRTALERCVTLFLEDLDGDLRPYFEALSVLRAFDEMRMRPLLRAYSPEFASRTWDYAACRKVRERLVVTMLARWNGDARGYVLDEPLRLVLQAALHEHDLELWGRLHCAAHRLYADWAERYEQSREWWAQEARYHADCLEGAGRSPADCPEEESQEEGENGD